MTRFIAKVWKPVALLVDALLIIDIATDLIKKCKDRKAKKNNSAATEEEPVVEEAPAV